MEIMTAKAFTIREFCEAHRISQAFFYENQKDEQRRVRVTNLGARRIITDEDAAEWRRRMSEASSQSAA
jgi:hypothetical protein